MKLTINLLFFISLFSICDNLTAQCWQSISTGGFHNYGIRQDGTLWAWGDNQYGVLGDSSFTDQPWPKQLGNSNQWKLISAADRHALGIQMDGTLWGWGDNYPGVFGNGTTISRLKPFQISSDTNWKWVTVGFEFSLALKKDSTLWSWGYNPTGQLGTGNNTSYHAPTRIGSASNWTIISSGNKHSMALNSKGELWSWGQNSYGEVGIGLPYNNGGVDTPTKLLGTWKYISCGIWNSFGIKTDGTLWGWGRTEFGQINGFNADVLSPEQIGTDTTWEAVSASEFHVVAIKADGTLWTWGRNIEGQLGDSTRTNHGTPTQVGTANTWKTVFAARRGTLALQTDASLWAWGSNSNGQQGDGTTADKIVPTKVDCAIAGIKLNTQSLQFSLYPNPVHGNNLLIKLNEDATLKMFDFTGKQVYQANLLGGENILQLPEFIEDGIYFLHTKNSVQKVIIHRAN